MSFRTRQWVGGLAVALAVAAVGCKSDNGGGSSSSGTMSSTSDKSLYERLGGQPAISKVVSDFVDRAAGDPAVNFTREGHPNHWQATPENVAKLKEHLTQFVVQATGGPQDYHGKDMQSLHTGMQITDAEFTAIANDLKATLVQDQVPAKEQDDLMKVVASTHDQIVGH